jgi:hypothetical protein
MLKTIMIIVILSFAWTVYKNERQAAQHHVAQKATMQDKQQAAINSNEELNRGLPKMLDSQTMLTRVEASTGSTTYHIKMVNYPSVYLDQAFLSKAQEIIGGKNCVDSDIQWSFNQGLHMKYIVFGSDNKQAGSFIISKGYCQRFS